MALSARVRRAATRWPSALVFCASVFYAATVAWLIVWIALPVLGGLRPMVISSGSMGPRIAPGDVVMVARQPAVALRRGTVITFADEAVPGRLVTHRITGLDADGRYRTKGDANPAADSTPVHPEQVRGVGRLLVPAVGLPFVWLSTGRWPLLIAWGAGSVLAIAYIHLYPRYSAPLHWGWESGPARARRSSRGSRGSRAGHPLADLTPGPEWSTDFGVPPAARRRAVPVGVAVTTAVILVVVAITVPAVSSAAFVGQTSNNGNTLSANTCFPRAASTLTATGDAILVQSTPTTNYGTNASLGVQSLKNGQNYRSMVDFAWPDPGTCTISATLRLFTTSATTGRTIQVLPATAAWDEATVTWASQPGTSATIASVAAAAGWIELDVSALVTELYAAGTYGFVLRDSVENNNAQRTNIFSAREGANPPELVISFS